MALVNGPLDERLLGVEVENIELVDPGRHDQQRAFENGFGRRLVLDDLADFILGDHLARRNGDVLADLELRRIGLTQPQLALAGGDVLGKHLHALDQVFAIGRDHFLVELGIGGEKIGR
jgi:hypothetical protein